MSGQYTDSELTSMIVDANERAQIGRLARLRYLTDLEDTSTGPVDALALEYDEEARLCWYMGAFIASIIMTQMAFEELLRSHYRVTNGVGGDLNNHVSVDMAGFAALVEQAKSDGWLSIKEKIALDTLRKEYRNPYVHPHDQKSQEDMDVRKPNFLDQHFKIYTPELFGRGVEDDSKDAVKLLITLFQPIAWRFWGKG